MFNLSHFFTLVNFEHRSLFDDIKYPWQALEALAQYLQYYFNSKNKKRLIWGQIEKGAILKDKQIFIGKGSKVEAGAYIYGPTIIGENCEIRNGAYIRGQVITGNNCFIGHCSEIKNAIFLDKAMAPHFNYVGDSILGQDVNLGAGSILANHRFDDKEIIIQDINTGLRKLGAILGDNVQIGCNAVLAPGTLVYKDSWVLPGQYLKSGVWDKERLKVLSISPPP